MYKIVREMDTVKIEKNRQINLQCVEEFYTTYISTMGLGLHISEISSAYTYSTLLI